jgi:hypothetical protein
VQQSSLQLVEKRLAVRLFADLHHSTGEASAISREREHQLQQLGQDLGVRPSKPSGAFLLV